MKKNISNLASISLLGNIVGKATRYLTIIVIARLLGQNALGVFSFGIVLMEICGIIARGGLGTAAQRFIPKYREEGEPEKTLGYLVSALIIAPVIGTMIALILTSNKGILEDNLSTFTDESVIFVWMIPLYALMMVAAQCTKAFQDTRYFVYSRELLQSSLALIGAIIGGYVFGSLYSISVFYLASLFLGASAAILFLYHLTQETSIQNISFNVKKHVSYSVTLLFVAVTIRLISWSDIMMLGFFVPSQDVGWYQSAYQTSILLLVLIQAVNSIFPPVASSLYERGDLERLEKLYRGISRLIGHVTILGFIYVVLFANVILSIFGTPTADGINVLLIFAGANTVSVLVGPAGYLLSMTGNARVELLNTASVSVLNIILNFVLIQELGVVGAAIASAFSLILLNCIRIGEVYVILNISPISYEFLTRSSPLIGSLLVLLALCHISPSQLLSASLVGVAALASYLLLLYRQGFDEDESQILESINESV